MGELSELFAPDRIALVGATEREGSVGRAIMENLAAFEGSVIPVNPNYDEVLGTPCVESVEEADADLVIVVVPPDVALDVVRQAGDAGVEHVVVITAGFGETGGGGATRERELRQVADEYDVNVVGPNSLGIMSTPKGMNATFAPENALEGKISFMSQSGAFITAVLDWAKDQDIGFKDVVSLGNKAVLDETDFVRHWGGDEGTDVIIGYLESIETGRAFIDAARTVTSETPIVVVKSGRTDAGAQAASSHTGAIAGSDRAYEAGLEQAGVIRAETVEDLFDAARMLADQPLPETNGVGIVTNAGGPGVLATDAVGDSDLKLASFTDETVSTLSETMPEEANIYNPVDAIGDASVERFSDALEAVIADKNVGSVVVLSAPTAVLDYEELAVVVTELQATHEVPIATCLMGGTRVESAQTVLNEVGIPNYFDPARAVRSLDALWRYRTLQRREYESPTEFDVDRDRVNEILSVAARRGESRLGVEAMDILDAYGIPIPAGGIAETPTEALELADSIEGAVVMKIVSPDILHKSDIGGVRVGVDVEDVYDTFEDLMTRARSYQPNATILGVQVQELVDLDESVETIVGANKDPQFGPLLLFGLGGIFVETLKDTSFRVAPVSEREAREMLDEIRSAPLLRGARGRSQVDRRGVVEAIQRLSQLVTDVPAILELDVNPLVATPDGVAAVDIRLTIDLEKL
ncbi:MAG: acetate--CoA ligase family protein [Halobacteriota archaeon]